MARIASARAASNKARRLFFSTRNSGTAAKATARVATRAKPIVGTALTALLFSLASVLVAHQRHDHAAYGARLLIGKARTHYHGADVAYHGFALGGRKEEFCRIQFPLQMLQ